MRAVIAQLVLLLVATLALAMPQPQKMVTNAERFAAGLPPLPPKNMLRCPPGGCSAPTVKRFEATRAGARRATTSSTPDICSGYPNYQLYQQGIAGIMAPAVCKINGYWYNAGKPGVKYNFINDAIDQSCYVQMDNCQLAANQGGNKAPLTVSNCNGGQIDACKALGVTTTANYAAAHGGSTQR